MINLLLYGTSGCHLCEEAEALLSRLEDEHSITLQLVDIADDESLVEAYGIRIPVLINTDKSELSWPFNENDLRAWLKRN
ncbi:MAG: glutaredoxin family protein [Methylophilaceae bacterium]|jgi:glutaredoxin|nr:glutaredoxin family protein [Methyloradius sp.]